MFNRKAKGLQQEVHGVLWYAVGGVQKLNVDAPKAVNSGLRLIVAPSKCDESAKLGSTSAHSVDLEPRYTWASAASDSGGAFFSKTYRSSVPASSGATDCRDYSGQY